MHEATPVMAKALWNGKVIAESDTTEMVEGNIYFPESSLKREYFRPSSTISTCPWKGQARYYSLLVDGQENQDAAWYYPDPKPAARNVKNHVAFWRGVEVEKKHPWPSRPEYRCASPASEPGDSGSPQGGRPGSVSYPLQSNTSPGGPERP